MERLSFWKRNKKRILWPVRILVILTVLYIGGHFGYFVRASEDRHWASEELKRVNEWWFTEADNISLDSIMDMFDRIQEPNDMLHLVLALRRDGGLKVWNNYQANWWSFHEGLFGLFKRSTDDRESQTWYEGDKMSWFNYRTGENEYIKTPKDFSDYIPQVAAAQNLYRVYLKKGKTPLESAYLTLAACIDTVRGTTY